MTNPEDDILKNLAKLRAQFPEVGRAFTIELAGEAEKEIETEIVRNTPDNVTIGKTPIITGDMVSTTRVETDNERVAVVVGGIPGKSGNMVNYAYFVEEGTSKFKGRKCVKGGVSRALKNKDSFARKGINSWIRNNI